MWKQRKVPTPHLYRSTGFPCEWTPATESLLIELVRKFPILWDSLHPCFHPSVSRETKESIWKDVALEINTVFNLVDNPISSIDAKIKYATLICIYNSHLHSGNIEMCKKWTHFKKISYISTNEDLHKEWMVNFDKDVPLISKNGLLEFTSSDDEKAEGNGKNVLGDETLPVTVKMEIEDEWNPSDQSISSQETLPKRKIYEALGSEFCSEEEALNAMQQIRQMDVELDAVDKEFGNVVNYHMKNIRDDLKIRAQVEIIKSLQKYVGKCKKTVATDVT